MHSTLNLNRFTQSRNEIYHAATFTLRPQYAATLKLLRELFWSRVFLGAMNGFVWYDEGLYRRFRVFLRIGFWIRSETFDLHVVKQVVSFKFVLALVNKWAVLVMAKDIHLLNLIGYISLANLAHTEGGWNITFFWAKKG